MLRSRRCWYPSDIKAQVFYFLAQPFGKLTQLVRCTDISGSLYLYVAISQKGVQLIMIEA